MDVIDVLHDKKMKTVQKRAVLAEALRNKALLIDDAAALLGLTDKDLAIILEAMEEVTRIEPSLSDSDWLTFAEQYIESNNNTLKREASRVIGNIAHLYADKLDSVIDKLLANCDDSSTVVRWGSAYALGRIILIPVYADSNLFDTLTEICGQEPESGVKNQYLAGLKKAKRIRG
jgi:hypothetical protein